MTSISPPKITSLPAGTPSGEWADKTESMLQSDTIITDPAMKTTPKAEEHPITTTTNVNTPGHEFPGSYPKELESEEQEQREPRVGNGSEGPPMASVVHAARQHMPDNVERTVEYAGQRAAAYLPIPQGIKDTVNSYWSYDQEGTHPGQQLSTSLPSSEAKGAQPFEHVGGVGSLPGTLSESSVALLPDERATRTPVSKDESRTQPEGDNQAKSAASPAGAAAAAGKTESFIPSKSPLSQVQSSQETDTQQVEKARTTKTDNPPAKVSEPESNTQKPYEVPEEQRSRIAEAAGVGGTAVGAGSAATQSQEAQAQTRNQPRNETAGAGVAGGAIGANGLSKDDREHKQAKLTSQETQQKTREETQSHTREVTDEEGVKHTHNAGAGTGDTDYRPAKMYPAHTGERADQGRAQPTSPVSPTSATTASVNDSPKERRVSFLHKVRGEVKIIAGKVSGNEGKVEEGKRIIHGEL